MTTTVTSKTDYHHKNQQLFRRHYRESLDGYIQRHNLSYDPQVFFEQVEFIQTYFYKINGAGDKLVYMMRRRESGLDDIKTHKSQIFDALFHKYGESLEQVLLNQDDRLLLLVPSCVHQVYNPSSEELIVTDNITHTLYSNVYVPPKLKANDVSDNIPKLFKDFLDRLIPPDEMCWYKSNPENRLSQQEFVLKWLSQRVQYPATDPTVALVLTGEQGTGKSFLFDNIMRPIVGEHNYLTTNLKTMTGRFTKSIFNNTLIHIEEVDDNRTKTLDRLKELTKKHHYVEDKNISAQQVTKHFGYVVSSNKQHPIKVELSDRRHFFTSYSKIADDTHAFIQRFASWLENDNGLQDILNYLYCLDISGFDERECPLSETKLNLMEQESYTDQGIDIAKVHLMEHTEYLYKPRDIADGFKISIILAQKALRDCGYKKTPPKRWIQGGQPFSVWKHISFKNPKSGYYSIWRPFNNVISFNEQKKSDFDDGFVEATGENQALSSPI